MSSRFALAGLSVCLAIHLPALAQQPIPIRVNVEPLVGSKLRVHLTNASTAGVTLYSSRLPWGTRYSMIIAAVKLTGTNESLVNSPVIDDPPPGEVAIDPGQTVSGEIDLAPRFHQTWQGARGKPLLIFWSYQLQTTDGRRSDRVSGSLELTPR